MSFTGKATYSAGTTLPEIAEDVSDLVSLASPHETPLLDALGDPRRSARSTVHEWLEDALLPNDDTVSDESIASPTSETSFEVANPDRFRVGDQVLLEGKGEVMLVTGVNTSTSVLSVTRAYGGSTAASLADADALRIIGNAALEGADADPARFTARTRMANYTQIFSSTVEVSGSELAVRQIGLADEMDYQKQQRTRELLRDLENSVINGRAPALAPQGSGVVRRSMNGLISFITTNVLGVGQGGFPSDTALTEKQLNLALRQLWTAGGQPDLIVVGGREKRALNAFLASNRRYTAEGETYKDALSIYESDFGVCRVILSRWTPPGTVLLLDSTRIEVLPLSGRSFQFQPLARTGDRDAGQLIGEYTLELRNQAMHGIIKGFTA